MTPRTFRFPAGPSTAITSDVRSHSHRLVQLADLLAGQHPDAARPLIAQRHRTDVGAHQTPAPGSRPRPAAAARCACGPRAASPAPASCPARVSTTAKSSTRAGPSSSSTPARSLRAQPARHRAGDRRQIGLGHLVRRMHQPVRQLAVVGQQQQPLGVGVEASDVKQLLVPAHPVLDQVTDAAAGPGRRTSSSACRRGFVDRQMHQGVVERSPRAPSTRITETSGSTRVPSSVTIRSSTSTRPSRIIFSATRREAIPACDNTFCSRTPIRSRPSSVLVHIEATSACRAQRANRRAS